MQKIMIPLLLQVMFLQSLYDLLTLRAVKRQSVFQLRYRSSERLKTPCSHWTLLRKELVRAF